jgi:hypothetical protein
VSEIIRDADLQHITNGLSFVTEPDAWAHFDALMEANKSFRIYREVSGEYIQPRPQTEDKTARVDRLMMPLPKALEAGWRGGAIAIEGKKSDCHVGRLVTQALDYSRCAWTLGEEHTYPGLTLMTRWVFVYPVERQHGDLESIMVQNRIGYVIAHRRTITFGIGATNAIKIFDDGTVQIARSLPMGRKRGSR